MVDKQKEEILNLKVKYEEESLKCKNLQRLNDDYQDNIALLKQKEKEQKEEISNWKEKYEKESKKLKDKCKEMENNQRNQIEERGRYNNLLFREVQEQVIGVTEVVTKEVINFG